jgi:putative signal transducing protein
VKTQLRIGYAAVGLAVAVAVAGGVGFPNGLQWVVAAVLLWVGLTLIGRGRGWSLRRRSSREVSARSRRRASPLQPGETYQDAVKLALVPNVPLAELWCQRLRQNGIEAFYKGAAPFVASGGGVADLNQGLPAEIWVGEDDAARACELFPELGS